MTEHLHLLSAQELSTLFKKGELSAQEITKYFLNRISEKDPLIKAFTTVLEKRALDDAKKLDEKRLKGEKLGKLAAVPIALKDNIHLQGELTTCSSRFLKNYKAPFDATVTTYLKESDAIFIAKTNMDEFAMGSSTENSAFFKTHNPWNLNCVPGGSSGGSAAAVSARLVPLALGSDTGGSIRQPASFCGVLGFKPTYGRVSRYGLVAFGSSFDQIGPLANNAQDIALMMEVIGKKCPYDATCIQQESQDYFQDLQIGVKGMKIGVPWDFIETVQEETKQNFIQEIDRLKSIGAEIVSIDLSLLKHSLAIYYILATAEASTNLARFDGIRYGIRSPNAKTLEQVFDLSKEEGFGQEVKRRILLGTYVLSSGFKDAYYKKAQQVRTKVIEQFHETFKKCQTIAMPVSPFPAFEFNSIQDPLQMYFADIFTISANLAGLPAISVPSGLSKEQLPFGIQFLGPQYADTQVVQVASAYENSLSSSFLPKGF